MAESVVEKLRLKMDDSLPLRDVVFRTLRDAILEGTLPPGTRLMELQLSGQLGVSRTPVREALKMLSMESLVTLSARRGAVVAPIQASNLKDALEVRAALEELAVRKACRNMDEETLSMLERAELEFEQALNRQNTTLSARQDVHFHDIILQTAHNRRLMQQLTQIREEIYRYRLENLKDEATYRNLVAEHRQIIQAFRGRDEERAAEVMTRHIENQAQSLLAHLDEG